MNTDEHGSGKLYWSDLSPCSSAANSDSFRDQHLSPSQDKVGLSARVARFNLPGDVIGLHAFDGEAADALVEGRGVGGADHGFVWVDAVLRDRRPRFARGDGDAVGP